MSLQCWHREGEYGGTSQSLPPAHHQVSPSLGPRGAQWCLGQQGSLSGRREAKPCEVGVWGWGWLRSLRGGSLLQECPTGLVDEDTFKLIYSQFFPQGGESQARPSWLFPKPRLWSLWQLCRRWVSLSWGGDPHLYYLPEAWCCLCAIGRGGLWPRTQREHWEGGSLGWGSGCQADPTHAGPGPCSSQMPPPTHTSSSMPSMQTGMGPSALR